MRRSRYLRPALLTRRRLVLGPEGDPGHLPHIVASLIDDPAEIYRYADFTEENYRAIVVAAAGRYAFEPYGTSADHPHVLWRHDVDFSVHRGLALARIEAEAGVRATYFFGIRSAFYNLLESPVNARAREILNLGHWLGLHFDPSEYEELADAGALEDALAFERRLLSEILEASVDAVSFHNPTTVTTAIDPDVLAGMANAYGRDIRERYTYVSDSNGYWRDESLQGVIEAGSAERLHVLTHPEWWQAEPMSPRDRMERSIAGRAASAREAYEGPVRKWGRGLPG